MSTAPATQLPLAISIAPFPEGFQGDMDETFQQAVILMEAFLEGNFLTGLVLPPGSTLPTTDQGPIAMGGAWYFWDTASGQYQPQSVPVKLAKNFARNAIYQVAQMGPTFTQGVGVTPTFDMSQFRATVSNVLTIASAAGPPASPDNDDCITAAKYTVTNTVATLQPTDIFAHEHLFEGSDLAPLQGETLSLAFSVFCNAAGVYSAYLTSSGRDESYVFSFTIATANTWQRIKIQGIPAIPSTGTWHFGEGQTGMYFGVTLAVGTQWQTTSVGSWQAAFLAGTSANLNLLAVVANSMTISGVKLEASPSCTPLTVNSFAEDYESVIRYYFTNFTYQRTNQGVPLALEAPAPGTWFASLIYPRRMCRAPTVKPFGYQSFTIGNITNMRGGTATDIPVATINSFMKGISDSQAITPPTGLPTANGTITAISIAGATTALNSSAITGVTPASAQYVLPGASVSGTGIPAGATVKSYNSALQTLYISALATAAGTVTLSISSPLVGSMTTMAGVAIGLLITGTGVPPNTTVLAILSANSILATNPITPGTVTLTFGGGLINLNDPLFCFFQADARLS
jgi:hypothetical protein